MERNVLSKDVRIENNKVIISENTETVLDKSQVESKLRDVQVRKSRLAEQNQRLVDEYRQMESEESELNGILQQLLSNETIKEI